MFEPSGKAYDFDYSVDIAACYQLRHTIIVLKLTLMVKL